MMKMNVLPLFIFFTFMGVLGFFAVTVSGCCLMKELPYILFEKDIHILAL